MFSDMSEGVKKYRHYAWTRRGAARPIVPRPTISSPAESMPGSVESVFEQTRQIAAETEALLVDEGWHVPEPKRLTAQAVAVASEGREEAVEPPPRRLHAGRDGLRPGERGAARAGAATAGGQALPERAGARRPRGHRDCAPRHQLL